MSLYEVLAVAVLVGAGGLAYRLYLKDTRPGESGAPEPPPASGGLMFGRDRNRPDNKR